jgi:hypothetical protein
MGRGAGKGRTMPEKCDVYCPHCADYVEKYGDRYHLVYAAGWGRYIGKPRCSRHGCVYVDGEWFFVCRDCGKRVDGLYGLMIPHLCKECYDAICAEQRRLGQVCSTCRNVIAACYC